MSWGSKHISRCSDEPGSDPSTFVFRGTFQLYLGVFGHGPRSNGQQRAMYFRGWWGPPPPPPSTLVVGGSGLVFEVWNSRNWAVCVPRRTKASFGCHSFDAFVCKLESSIFSISYSSEKMAFITMTTQLRKANSQDARMRQIAFILASREARLLLAWSLET